MSDGTPRSRRPGRSSFHVGDRVRIRSAEQIAATLDQDGTLDGLPFMPEMAAFCGRTVTVRASAHKTCDSINLAGLRSMDRAVHLEGLSCDGAAHGGCQSRCPLFWKDAWLEPASERPAHSPENNRGGDGALAERCASSLRLHGRDPAQGTFSCQGTEVLEATSPLPFWSARQYWDDVRTGNITLGALLRGLPVIVFNKFQFLSRRFLPPVLRIRGGRLYPEIVGTLEQSPDVRVGIEPGEAVEIRSHREILGTLDTRGCNRGLAFDVDMVPFCGHTSTVHHRVEVRIDERTGELKPMKNPCLVLDGVVCEGHYHRFCPRALDSYWREAWLRRDKRPAQEG